MYVRSYLLCVCALTGCLADAGIDGGGVRVDASFTTYLRRELTAIPDFADTEDIPDILSDACRDFESRCKRTFTSPSESCTVRIGGRKMNSKRLGVAKGILTLDGYSVNEWLRGTFAHDFPQNNSRAIFQAFCGCNYK